MAAEIDFQPYLQSISTHYEQWWRLYTLTDAETQAQQKNEPQPWKTPFDFGLMVQTVQRDRPPISDGPDFEAQSPKEKIERFPVLEGIRKYVKEHRQVLLVGRPGSGKSTTLARLLLEEAQNSFALGPLRQAQGNAPSPPSLGGTRGQTAPPPEIIRTQSPPILGDLGGRRDSETHPESLQSIPVLVELRFLSNSTLLDRIQAFFQRHDLQLDRTQIEDLLFHRRLLLLMDGLNELPSEAARLDVAKFRQDYPKVSMIFTTRDLSLGGDFGLEKKLEMQPLTEAQMQAFVRSYVPEQAEAMLRQLKDRLREFGQTPLLLWMLCGLFRQTGQIPNNLGEVFRAFTQGYERNLKADVPVESDRRWWPELLQELAFWMMRGAPFGEEAPAVDVEFRVAVSKTEVRQIFANFLQGKEAQSDGAAQRSLDDILRHHLIQINGEIVEFQHQMLQEYYAAEYLLNRLNQIEDFELKRDYLNYLKWTEPLALMLRLEKESERAIRIIKSALEVDLQLGARLIGETQQEFHPQTIRILENLEIPDWFKISLLGKTKSSEAIETLNQALIGQDGSQSWYAIFALNDIGTSEEIFKPLMEALKNPDAAVNGLATIMLQEIVNEQFSDDLLSMLCDSPDSKFRLRVINILVKIPSDRLFDTLQEIFHRPDEELKLRKRAAGALWQVGGEKAVQSLQQLLQDSDLNIRGCVVARLANIKHESVVEPLMSVLGNRSENHNLRRTAAETLAEMHISQAVELMQEILLDFADNLELRQALPRQLEQYRNDKVVQSLLQISGNLQEELWLRISSVDALGTIRNKLPVNILQKIVLDQNEDSSLRSRSAISLARINEDKTLGFLLNIIEDENEGLEFRAQIIDALEWMTTDDIVVNKLQEILLDYSKPSELRRRAAYTLRHNSSQKTEEILIQILKGPSSTVVCSSVHALQELRSHAASSGLIELLKHNDCSVRKEAAYALGSIGSTEAISELINLLQDENLAVNKAVVFALTQIGGKQVANALLQVLPTLQDYSMLYSPVVHALEQGESEVVTEPLFQVFMAADSSHKHIAGEVLGKVASSAILSRLVSLIPEARSDALEVISAIQNRCKYYNYDLTQTTQFTQSMKLFFSYAHKDEPLRDELAKHLSLLKRQNIITDWHDRNITAGTDWAQAIDHNLDTANIILLLISADFLASDYCYDKEMTRALEHHNQGTARVIPIILRPCDWHSAPFGKLQALPKDAKPVTKWDNPDEAFTHIAQGIRKAVAELQQRKTSTTAAPPNTSSPPPGNVTMNFYGTVHGAAGTVHGDQNIQP